MREVKVKRDAVLERVRSNRLQHRGQYEKAFAGWRREAIAVQEENIQALKSGARRFVISVDSAPEDHTKDYDQVVEMMTMSVDDTLTLDNATFRQYVLDDWHWKDSWTVSNSKYMPQGS